MSTKIIVNHEVYMGDVINIIETENWFIYYVVKDCKPIEDNKYEITVDLYENLEKKTCH